MTESEWEVLRAKLEDGSLQIGTEGGLLTESVPREKIGRGRPPADWTPEQCVRFGFDPADL